VKNKNKKQDPAWSPKSLEKKGPGGMPQAIGCLPSKLVNPKFKPQYHQKKNLKEF
jgi:hypothetical protein